MSVRKRLSVLGLLVGMVGFLLVATSNVVGANHSAQQDAILTLSVSGNSGNWTLDSPLLQQDLEKTGGCTLVTQSGDPDLVSITGVSTADSSAFAGIRKGAIGTKDFNDGGGEPCARVDGPDQSLVLSLGADVSNTYLASGGQIALKFKFNASVTIDMYQGGLQGTLVATKLFNCDGGNDCGPDSGLNDVTAVPLDTLGALDRFDTISISTTGSVSLVSTPQKETHLHLALIPTYTISGIKYHDRQGDGVRDTQSPADEELSDWVIHAFDADGDVAATATTGTFANESDGYYEMTLPEGSYTICEELPPLDLPLVWTQVTPVDGTASACSGLNQPGTDPLGPDGYAFNLTADEEDVDFGNIRGAVIACDGTAQDATIDQEGNLPGSTISITCNKPGGGSITVPFDVGSSPDEDPTITQFVTVALDPTGTETQSQTIFWAEETAVYDGNNTLQVKTTKVIFEVGGTPVDVVFCEAGDPQPDPGNPHCLKWQKIELGDSPDNSVSSGNMQLTEFYQYLGDPSNFR